MTEREWLDCSDPYPMLVFLRGPVVDPQQYTSHTISSRGNLYPGPSDRVSSRRLLSFMAACTDRLLRLPLDGPSKLALDAFQRYADGRADRQVFWDACSAVYESIREGKGLVVVNHLGGATWTADPKGANNVASDVAFPVAHHVARDSVAITCADATEDDWFAWGFCGGPPDPLFQATRAAEERAMADLLRHVVGNPFHPVIADPSWLAWNDGADGAVDAEQFPVDLIAVHLAGLQVQEDLVPQARAAPLAEAVIDGLPGAELRGQVAQRPPSERAQRIPSIRRRWSCHCPPRRPLAGRKSLIWTH